MITKSNSDNKSSTLSWVRLDWLIKLVVLSIFSVLIWIQITQEQQLASLWDAFVAQLKLTNIGLLILAIVLMPINWALESAKWGYLIRKFEKISYLQSFSAIMSGLTLGIITPVRIGEYGGRLLYVAPENKWKAGITTFVTSISQNLVNLTIGITCALLFVYIQFGMSQILLISGLCFALVFMTVLYLFYFQLHTLKKLFKKIKIPFVSKGIKTHLKVLKLFSVTDLTKVSLWSFTRYCTYSLQYVLLLYFFGIEGEFYLLFLGVSTIFLIQSSIPLPPLFNVFARSEIALVIWGLFSANEISILCSSFGLWVINLLIPAMIGLMLSMHKDIPKSFGYGATK